LSLWVEAFKKALDGKLDPPADEEGQEAFVEQPLQMHHLTDMCRTQAGYEDEQDRQLADPNANEKVQQQLQFPFIMREVEYLQKIGVSHYLHPDLSSQEEETVRRIYEKQLSQQDATLEWTKLELQRAQTESQQVEDAKQIEPEPSSVAADGAEAEDAKQIAADGARAEGAKPEHSSVTADSSVVAEDAKGAKQIEPVAAEDVEPIVSSVAADDATRSESMVVEMGYLLKIGLPVVHEMIRKICSEKMSREQALAEYKKLGEFAISLREQRMALDENSTKASHQASHDDQAQSVCA